MAEGNEARKRHADYKAMSTPALEELLRHDLQGDILDVEAISVVSHILTERRIEEDPDSIPPIDLQWKSFRENYLSFKARLRRLARRILPKLLIALAVLAVIGVIVWAESTPLLTESLTDIVSLEDGRFVVDGLGRGTTREDVIAWLEERNLPYSETDMNDYLKRSYGRYYENEGDPRYYRTGVSWVSIRGNTRLEELGKLNVRRTYYFDDGLLTFVELKAGPIRGDVRDNIRDFQRMILSAELSYGRAQGMDGSEWVPFEFDRPGEERALWQGADESMLELLGHYYRQLGGIVRVFSRDPRAGQMVDYFELTIRITL